MTLTQKSEANTITLKISGWLDVHSSQELEACLEKLPEVQNLIYDFSELEYISSSGIRVMIAAYRRQKDSGGNFEVTEVSPEVMEILEMTGIRKKIKISGSIA